MTVTYVDTIGRPPESQATSEVGQAVAAWRQVAGRHGLTEAEIDRMASAFEHEDSVAARELRA